MANVKTQENPTEIVYQYWKFTNPNGAKIKCKALQGTGRVLLYRNGKKIGIPYTISSEPQHPTAVHLNTGSCNPVIYTSQENDTVLKIARLYGVSVESLRSINNLNRRRKIYPGLTIKIPDTEWEVWIEDTGSGDDKFKVELLPIDQA